MIYLDVRVNKTYERRWRIWKKKLFIVITMFVYGYVFTHHIIKDIFTREKKEFYVQVTGTVCIVQSVRWISFQLPSQFT